eukprot:scaffold45859_cov58-Phaeocystis_antarctica.AAC.1
MLHVHVVTVSLAAAEPLLREAPEVRRETLGDRHQTRVCGGMLLAGECAVGVIAPRGTYGCAAFGLQASRVGHAVGGQWSTGCGRKDRGARMQPRTRGPEAVETKTMTVALPQRRQHRPARSTCADVSNVRSSPLGANTVCKSRNSFADALFTQGLMALMQPIICCVRAQSAREFVTEFSDRATLHRCGVAQS